MDPRARARSSRLRPLRPGRPRTPASGRYRPHTCRCRSNRTHTRHRRSPQSRRRSSPARPRPRTRRLDSNPQGTWMGRTLAPWSRRLRHSSLRNRSCRTPLRGLRTGRWSASPEECTRSRHSTRHRKRSHCRSRRSRRSLRCPQSRRSKSQRRPSCTRPRTPNPLPRRASVLPSFPPWPLSTPRAAQRQEARAETPGPHGSRGKVLNPRGSARRLEPSRQPRARGRGSSP